MTTINPHTTRAVGTILTASIYNTDHQNHVTNANSLNNDITTVAADVAALDVDKVDTARNVSTGSGLTGGGNLTTDRTLAVDFATEAEMITGTSTTDVANVATTVAGIKRHKLQVGGNINIGTTGVDTGAVAADGGAFAIYCQNGAGSGYNLEISLDGGSTYTTILAIGSSQAFAFLIFAKGGVVTGLYAGSANVTISVTPTAGAGNIFLRRSAAGTATVYCNYNRFL